MINSRRTTGANTAFLRQFLESPTISTAALSGQAATAISSFPSLPSLSSLSSSSVAAGAGAAAAATAAAMRDRDRDDCSYITPGYRESSRPTQSSRFTSGSSLTGSAGRYHQPSRQRQAFSASSSVSGSGGGTGGRPPSARSRLQGSAATTPHSNSAPRSIARSARTGSLAQNTSTRPATSSSMIVSCWVGVF